MADILAVYIVSDLNIWSFEKKLNFQKTSVLFVFYTLLNKSDMYLKHFIKDEKPIGICIMFQSLNLYFLESFKITKSRFFHYLGLKK